MLRYPLILLTGLLLFSNSLPPVAPPGVGGGATDGSFIHGGLGLKKPLSPENSPLQGNQSWSIYCRVGSAAARVLPAYASDNFVSLLPGERRRITLEIPASAGGVTTCESS